MSQGPRWRSSLHFPPSSPSSPAQAAPQPPFHSFSSALDTYGLSYLFMRDEEAQEGGKHHFSWGWGVGGGGADCKGPLGAPQLFPHKGSSKLHRGERV